MSRSEAIAITKARRKARKAMDKYQNLLWKTSLSDPDRSIYQERYDKAAADLQNGSQTFKQAMKELLG